MTALTFTLDGETTHIKVGISYIFGVTPTNPVDIYKASHTYGTGYAYAECISNAEFKATVPGFTSTAGYTEAQRTFTRRGGRCYCLTILGTGDTVSALNANEYKENIFPSTRGDSGGFLFFFSVSKNGQLNATTARYFGTDWTGTKTYGFIALVVDNAGFDEQPLLI